MAMNGLDTAGLPSGDGTPRSRHVEWRRLLPWVAVLAAVALGVVFASMFLWVEAQSGKEPQVSVGMVNEFRVNQPAHFADQHFWLVRRQSSAFVALYDVDPQDGCTVPWRPDFEFMGYKGWFRNPCHAQTYDIDGRCFSGPCLRGLDRFPVTVPDGRVLVDTAHRIPGPSLGPEYQPQS